MKTGRLEAFSDGVLAIIITIMVLELKVPHGESLATLAPLVPAFLSYVLSFLYIGIYWNNHHHMFQLCEKITGPVLWANLHLLFWLSLYPFTTAWMDESDLARAPTLVYGVNLLAAAIAYTILQQLIIRGPGGAGLREAMGADVKGKLSPLLYVAGILLVFVSPVLGLLPFVAVAVMWMVPDRRIEAYLAEHEAQRS